MGNVPQHKIDEAAKRGIVPGATVMLRFGFYSGGDNAPYVVPDYSEWEMYGVEMAAGNGALGSAWIHARGSQWVEVITPAPSKEEEGLKEGDACEVSAKGSAFLVELAKELGVPVASDCVLVGSMYCGLRWDQNHQLIGLCTTSGKSVHTPEAFIAKMRVTAKHPKPIVIRTGSGCSAADHEAKFNKGSVTVGCTTVPNDKWRAVTEKLID